MDFESVTSANSITPARCLLFIAQKERKRKDFFKRSVLFSVSRNELHDQRADCEHCGKQHDKPSANVQRQRVTIVSDNRAAAAGKQDAGKRNRQNEAVDCAGLVREPHGAPEDQQD